MTATDELAQVIHDACCGDQAAQCPRWAQYSRHQGFYYDRAQSIMGQLEPVIGAANVIVACRVILDEME